MLSFGQKFLGFLDFEKRGFQVARTGTEDISKAMESLKE